MAVGRPGTFTFINCTDLIAGMDHCALKDPNPPILTSFCCIQLQEGSPLLRVVRFSLQRCTLQQLQPVPTPSHVATTNITGFYDGAEAKGVFDTDRCAV